MKILKNVGYRMIPAANCEEQSTALVETGVQSETRWKRVWTYRTPGPSSNGLPPPDWLPSTTSSPKFVNTLGSVPPEYVPVL